MCREYGEGLTFTWRVACGRFETGVIGENGRIFGGSERHLGIVGAPTLKSGGPMGEVDLERSLDGGWSCLELVAVRAVKALRGLVWSRTTMVDVVV